MRWKELESDIKIGNITELYSKLDCLSVIYATINLANGIRVYASSSCTKAIFSHVRASSKEVGGLLLGKVYKSNVQSVNTSEVLTIVTEVVPSLDFKNSSISLEMGTEIWNRINDNLMANTIVVGWYHSHPNLGAFFSGTDRRTQKAFFNKKYSLGWVIDPIRNEQKIFCGGESEEYKQSILELDYGL